MKTLQWLIVLALVSILFVTGYFVGCVVNDRAQAADASKMVEPNPQAPLVTWHPGSPFTPASVVAEPTGRVR